MDFEEHDRAIISDLEAELATLRAENSILRRDFIERGNIIVKMRGVNERLRQCLHVTDYFLRAMTGPDDATASAIFEANKEALK